MQDNILSSEKYIFQTPIDDWKDKMTNQLEEWLAKYTPVFQQSLRLAKKHTKENTQDLHNFYATTATLPVAPPFAKPRQIRKRKQPRQSLIQRTLKN
jgi:hypothetical protein